jgi:hypothetical protein
MPVDFRIKRRLAYVRRNRCGVLLVALCLFVLINPFVAGSFAAVFLALGLVIILMLAMWALRARRGTLLVLGLLALFTVNAVAVDRLGEHWLRPATLLVTAVFLGAVTTGLLYYVLDWRPISTDKVFGAVAAYVLIAFTSPACSACCSRFSRIPSMPRRSMRRTSTWTGRHDVLLLHGADLDRLRRDHAGHQDGAQPDHHRAGAGRDVMSPS